MTPAEPAWLANPLRSIPARGVVDGEWAGILLMALKYPDADSIELERELDDLRTNPTDTLDLLDRLEAMTYSIAALTAQMKELRSGAPSRS